MQKQKLKQKLKKTKKEVSADIGSGRVSGSKLRIERLFKMTPTLGSNWWMF